MTSDGSSFRFETDRTFQIWRYTVGHGQLLLRSTKEEGGPTTRVDILFKGVDWIDMPTRTNGLRIEPNGEHSFSVSGEGWTGRVAAGGGWAREDDGSYADPSPFEGVE